MSSSKYAEPFRIKMVEPLKKTTREHREKCLKDVCYNVFQLKSEDIYIDCLTDSGTSAMSNKQWAAMMMGDESYAGCESFYRFEEAIRDVTGFKYIIPTHQGRGADGLLGRLYYNKPGAKYILNNMNFDSTKGAAMMFGLEAIDLLDDAGYDTTTEGPFKGNMSVKKLKDFIAEHGVESIAMVLMTVTCNTNGGQPVSIANIKEVSAVCKQYGLPFYADAARFCENSYFIHEREAGYANKTIKEIANEMFSYFDGCVMSAKKDALVNMGGFLATNVKEIYDVGSVIVMSTEGFKTYGGLAGRDLEAVAVGIREGSTLEYLEGRTGQVRYLAERLDEYGIPYVRPAGGNGVYLDARKFFPQIAPERFPGLCLAAEAYLMSGIRIAELGASAFSVKDENGVIHLPEIDLVRIAISRRVYTNSHMDVIAETLGELYKNGSCYGGMEKLDWGRADSHFNSRYAPIAK